MKSPLVLVIASMALAACGDPVAEQAVIDSRFTAQRADHVLALDFGPGIVRPDPAQESQLRAWVGDDRHGQRDEFVVVSDGSGGAMQQHRAAQVAQSLSRAGARWVSTSVEPSFAAGPDKLVVVRSEYRLGTQNCPSFTPSTIWNPNESLAPNYGCANAYNMGQMLARPRDAVAGRSPGPADGAVNAEAVQRYREGRARAATPISTTAVGGGGAAPGGTGSPPPQ
jgi:pilus biogenesis lipoprotein CpaD